MAPKTSRKRKRTLDAYERLQKAATRAAQRVEDALQDYQLSTSQYGVLSTISEHGSTHQQELASALGRSKAQITAIIDVLEQRALVRRERRLEDKRFITVHLTDAGRAILTQVLPARDDAVVEVMRGLTGTQRVRLSRLCRKLLRATEPQHRADAIEDAAIVVTVAPAPTIAASASVSTN